MALSCLEGFDVERLHRTMRTTYARVAADPQGEFHFQRGPAYAETRLNYSREELGQIPAISASRFCGVGNPHRAGPLNTGETVLDHACGSGADLILAARRVGPRGRVIGIDMSRPMLDCAWRGMSAAGTDAWTTLCHGVFEDLPVDDASIDVVISNGALNLAADKRIVFAEVFRVLKPGGRLHLADVVVQRELPADALANLDLRAACITGALLEREMFELAAMTGFVRERITERFDCFRGMAAEYAVSREARIGAMNFFARKPLI